MMKWLTLDMIKAQCRIEEDFTAEDDLLEMYGESAEDSILDILSRTYEDLMEAYGKIPLPIVQASLMLVDASYQYRSPVSQQNIYLVHYSFDRLVKPYMRLASQSNNGQNQNQYGCKNL